MNAVVRALAPMAGDTALLGTRLNSGLIEFDPNIRPGEFQARLGLASGPGANLLRSLLDSGLDGIVVADSNGFVHYANQAALTMYGYREHDVVGCNLPRLLPPSVLEEYDQNGQGVRRFNGVSAVRRDNSELPLDVRIIRQAFEDELLILVNFRDMTDFKRQQREIERLAQNDTLTRLPRRQVLEQHITKALASGRRYVRNCALFYIDLDGFKPVNDTLGHQAGDRVLREFARRFKSCARETDTVARLGGDEFGILFTDMESESHVRMLAERVIAVCKRPVEINSGATSAQVVVGASIGIAIFPRDGGDMQGLLHRADQAMYYAKSQGGAQYAFYTPELTAISEEKNRIERGLKRALEEGGLVLYYQPQIDLNTGAVVGAEALMRWIEDGRVVPPNKFIPVAEESDLICRMGEWALREACKQAQVWYQDGLGNGDGIRVGVNLSVRQFNAKLPDLVFDVLNETGLSPRLLDVEVTESFLASDKNAKEILHRLQAGGVHVSIDDFGTGYSCLAYMRDLPHNTLKIDRSFVNNLGLPNSESDVAIVETIITLAEKLGRTTLAEGIENEDQMAVLKELGCHQCQGFLYAKPMPAEAFEGYVRERGL